MNLPLNASSSLNTLNKLQKFPYRGYITVTSNYQIHFLVMVPVSYTRLTKAHAM